MYFTTFSLFFFSSVITLVQAWLPTDGSHKLSAFTNGGTSKIRGVNLGSHFVFEPWMAQSYWKDTLGCKDSGGSGYHSEWDCVQGIGQDAANSAFQQHWSSWTSQEDINTMISYGLNTIRIPVGFWINEDLINDGEYYPKGGAFDNLRNVCRWAAAAGMYVILDLHGMPGVQTPNQAFTGRYTPNTAFYESDPDAERAYTFFEWIIENIHSSDDFSNVGTVEIINEPLQNTVNAQTSWLVKTFYPTAIDRIQQKEASLGVSDSDKVHVMTMDDLWDAGGNPTSSLTSSQQERLLFDDHNYESYSISSAQNISDFVSYACQDNRESAVNPKIVGEWSLSFSNSGDAFTPMTDHVSDYSNWFSAQQQQYEKLNGWVFWSWKTDLTNNAEQWTYQKAVEAGIIDKDLNKQLTKYKC
ncbi:CAZyme family GH5 [Paecilomyces variotii]|nr:CAZyme family GH5 [Paecilomyces variotii]